MWQIRHESLRDAPAVELLLDSVFGPARKNKPVYRLREGLPPIRHLSFVVQYHDKIVATIRFWPVLVGMETPAILLGPIAVEPTCLEEGVDEWLVRHALERAHTTGHKIALVIGHNDAYHRFGFSNVAAKNLELTGMLAGESLLALALTAGALDGVAGPVHHWPLPLQQVRQAVLSGWRMTSTERRTTTSTKRFDSSDRGV